MSIYPILLNNSKTELMQEPTKRRGKRAMKFRDVLAVMYPKASQAELNSLDEAVRPKTPEVIEAGPCLNTCSSWHLNADHP